MRKAKILTIFCTIFLLFFTSSTSFTAHAAFSPPVDIMSEGVYMVNLDNDIVIVSKNADQRIYPADTTDIMTCLVALENVKDFNAIVDVPYAVTDEFHEGNPNYTNVTNAGIEARQDNLTYLDCLHALMMRSACEAANIIAYNVGGGSIEHFVEMMNQTAEKIGCKNTRFVNAHGCYAENHYTTAYDLYLITRYAIDNYPGFMDICNTYQYIMPPNKENPASVESDGKQGYVITHDNDMLSPKNTEFYFEGCQGIKTGVVPRLYPKKEGKWDWNDYTLGSRSLVTLAERDGYRYLLVTLGAPYFDENLNVPDRPYSYDDQINLYKWAFSEFEYREIVPKNKQVAQAKVEKGEGVDSVGIVPTQDFSTLIPKSLDESAIQIILPTFETMTAPVAAGTSVGDMILKLNGEQIAVIPLVTETEVKLDAVANYRDRLGNIFASPIVIVLIILIVLLIIAIVALRIITKNKKRKQAELQRRRKIQMAPRAGSGVRRPGGNRPNNRR